MATTQQVSAQLVDGYRAVPTENHGKVRYQYFSFTQSGAGDIGSTVDLVRLPTGRVRVLPFLSYIQCSAFGASRTLSIGHYAYENPDSNDPGSTLVAENDSAFASAIDVSAAAIKQVATTLKYDMYSRGGIKLLAVVAGGTIPDQATLSGLIAYIEE